MHKANLLTPEEHASVTELQDLLIDQYVEHKEVLEEIKKARAEKMASEIKNSSMRCKNLRSGRMPDRSFGVNQMQMS